MGITFHKPNLFTLFKAIKNKVKISNSYSLWSKTFSTRTSSTFRFVLFCLLLYTLLITPTIYLTQLELEVIFDPKLTSNLLTNWFEVNSMKANPEKYHPVSCDASEVNL